MAGLLQKRREESSEAWEEKGKLEERFESIRHDLNDDEKVVEKDESASSKTGGNESDEMDTLNSLRENTGLGKKILRQKKREKRREKRSALYNEQQEDGLETDLKEKRDLLADEPEEDYGLENELREKKRKKLRRMAGIALSLACAYLVYLIYGAVMTDFVFDSRGIPVAETQTIEDVSEEHAFNYVAGYYYRARSLYESVIRLDYRMSLGEEDPLVIAPEYEDLLDTVAKLVTDIKAMTVETKYTNIQEMLCNWVATDIAVYCQNMSDSISLNDAEKAEQALLGRDVIYSDFAAITANMVTMGQNIKGVSITDMSSWSMEKYVAEELEGGKYSE